MTAEQKLEKCKELVRDWRSESKRQCMKPAHDGMTAGAICGASSGLQYCADELQAVLEETDE